LVIYEKEDKNFYLTLFKLKKNENKNISCDKCVVIENNSIIVGIVLIEKNFYKTWFDNHEASLFFFKNFVF